MITSVAGFDSKINPSGEPEGPGAVSDRPSRQTKVGGPPALMERTGEVLSDPTRRGKERPWVDKHLGSRKVSAAYSSLGQPKKAARCQDCGTVYPASPRQRVRRFPECWQQARRR